MDLIKCPICGEMYSSSYPRCPFCEEDGEQPRKISFTPRHRIADKKKAQSARGGMIVVLVLVLALLSWYLFGDNIVRRGDAPEETPDQTVEPNVPVTNPGANDDPFHQPPEDSAPGGETSGDVPNQPDEQAPGGTQDTNETAPTQEPVIDENVDVSNASLNRSDFTLSGVGDSFRVKVSGTEATPRWSIDNANVATIGSDGTVTAVANGTTTLRCKVGARELTCIVRVVNTGKTAAPAEAPTTAPTETTTPQTPTTQTPTTQAPPTSAAHVDASSLSVKTNYGTLLQKDPGTGYPDCTVRIGGDPISLKIVGTDVPVSSWTSDKTSVVEVGADGHLTPVSAGTAHVTATVGDAKITCIIRVR